MSDQTADWRRLTHMTAAEKTRKEIRRRPGPVACLLILAGAVFLTGIGWGLPSSSVDSFLFGGHFVWTGKQILALTPAWGENETRGADVASHALSGRDQPIVLNASDAQRAHIVLQYRLYSDQPDEMITLRALSSMRPGQGKLDPRLYQYGGLWIYPVGLLLKLTVNPTADLAFYLDHPEAFGRMYVVMRMYTVMWALLGVVVVFGLTARLTEGVWEPATAALLYIFMPVVVNMSHEAKPHLPGAILALMAVWAAAKFVLAGRTRWAIACGAACGASAAMVISGASAIVIVPVMLILRPMPRRRSVGVLFGALFAGALVYCVTNPYVVIHLLGDATLLRSNLGNSAAMYRSPASISGLWNAVKLICAGESPLLMIAGVVATAWMTKRGGQTGWLLLAVAMPVIIQFFLLASGKPAEYARFALLPDIILAIAAVVGCSSVRSPLLRWTLVALLCLTTVSGGTSYLLQFHRDAGNSPTRLIAAEHLESLREAGAATLAIDAEPAPYCLPPVNLFDWKIVLLARGASTPDWADVRIDPVDVAPAAAGAASNGRRLKYWNEPLLLSTPITWAAKSFAVETRDMPPPAPMPFH